MMTLAIQVAAEKKDFFEAVNALRKVRKAVATRVYNACMNLTEREGVQIPEGLVALGATALMKKAGFGAKGVILVAEVLEGLGLVKSAIDWVRPGMQRDTPRTEVLLKAMSGWTGYGYKDGKYIDDIQEYFNKVMDEARLGMRKGKPYLYRYLEEVEDLEAAGL